MLPQAFELFNSYIKSHSDTSVIGGSFLQNYNMSDYKVWALLRNAGVLLVMFPLMIIYIVAQRYFVAVSYTHLDVYKRQRFTPIRYWERISVLQRI